MRCGPPPSTAVDPDVVQAQYWFDAGCLCGDSGGGAIGCTCVCRSCAAEPCCSAAGASVSELTASFQYWPSTVWDSRLAWLLVCLFVTTVHARLLWQHGKKMIT